MNIASCANRLTRGIPVGMTSTNTPCPHCGTTNPPAHHLNDTGNLSLRNATDHGFCPVLAVRRNPQTTR